MKLDDFNEYIEKEIERQIEISVGYDSSFDQKIGIFLGFIILVFAQVIILVTFC